MSNHRVASAVFCAAISQATAQRFALFFVISGVVLADVVSLALDRYVRGYTV